MSSANHFMAHGDCSIPAMPSEFQPGGRKETLSRMRSLFLRILSCSSRTVQNFSIHPVGRSLVTQPHSLAKGKTEESA